jgi:hypothetical protein
MGGMGSDCPRKRTSAPHANLTNSGCERARRFHFSERSRYGVGERLFLTGKRLHKRECYFLCSNVLANIGMIAETVHH